MKSLVFDAGPVISLTINDLTWILDSLKPRFKGDFIITEAVKKELVDKPLSTKRFEFGALRVLRYIKKKTLKVIKDEEIDDKTKYLLDLANSCFSINGQNLKIVQYGEIETLALALKIDAEAVVIDERTTRLLIEDPKKLLKILSHKLHSKVHVNALNLRKIKKEIGKIKVIRSIDIIIIAYKLGMLDMYIPDLKEGRKILLDAVLWGAKLSGCSVTNKEIEQLIKREL